MGAAVGHGRLSVDRYRSLPPGKLEGAAGSGEGGEEELPLVTRATTEKPQRSEPAMRRQRTITASGEEVINMRRTSEIDREFAEIFSDINVLFREDDGRKRRSMGRSLTTNM